MPVIRVLLVDDHRVLRDGLRALIEGQADLEVVGEAGDGPAALGMVERDRPDVVVMDFTLPGMNGVESTALLKGAHPEVKILALTVHEDAGYLRRFLQAGASGYALKQTPAEELFRAIRTVASGGSYLDPALAGKLGPPPGGATGAGSAEKVALSERESAVVKLIAQGYSNKEAGALLGINAKTVETYKARSLEKLGLRSRADLVRYAIELGWLR